MDHPARPSKRIAGGLLAALCLALVVLVAVDALRPPDETVRANAFVMGTFAEAQLAGDEEDAQAVWDALRDAENQLLSRRRADSVVSQLNASQQAELPAQMEEWLLALQQVEEASGGAFCILLGRLSDLWNFDGQSDPPALPDAVQIAQALAPLSQGGLTVEQGSASLSDGLSVDLGAAGKGIACDIAKQILTERGVTSGVVSVGGNLLLLGPKERTIAIRDPFGGVNDSFATLRLHDCFVSTSGNYEKYFDLDGVRYHHILDPQTGYPADAGLCSVTVICGDGLLSDALSTACFVLGVEASLPLLERYEAQAVFVGLDGQVTLTDGLTDRFTQTSDLTSAASNQTPQQGVTS